METTGFNLAATIKDVAHVDANGQLAEMLQQYARDCRGLPADGAALHTANELVHVQTVAKAIAAMFGLPVEGCIAASRSVLLPHRRRDTALDLIDFYRGRHEPMESAVEMAAEPTTDQPPSGQRGLVLGKLSLPLLAEQNLAIELTGVET